MNFKKKFLIIFTTLITAPNFALAIDIPSFFGFDTSSPQAWINSIYRYGISLVALLALAGLIYGGFRYLTSAGNEEAVTSGKQAIFAALTGLGLMLFSHMILKTMDPRLVELRLNMPGVDLPEPGCQSDSDCSRDQACTNGTCVSRDDPRSSTDCNPNAPNQDSEVCEGRNGVGSRCEDPAGAAPPICTDTQLGQNSRGCIDNTRCNTGLVCVAIGSQHRCTDHNNGSPCGSNTDCTSRNCDIVGTCQPATGIANGNPCTSNEVCQSNICSNRNPKTCVNGTNNSCDNDNDCMNAYYCNMSGAPAGWRCQESRTEGSCERNRQCFSGSCTNEHCEDTGWE